MYNEKQKEIIALTLKLDLAVREFKKLNQLFDKVKNGGVDPNDPRLSVLLEKYKQTNEEITRITNRLTQLNEN